MNGIEVVESRTGAGSRGSNGDTWGSWWFSADFLLCSPQSCSCDHDAQPKSGFRKVADIYDHLLERSDATHDADDSPEDSFSANGSFMARCSTDEARTVVEPAETAKTLTLLKRLVARISPSEKVSHLGGDQYVIGGRAVQVAILPVGVGASVGSFSHLVGLVGQPLAMEASRVQVLDGPLRQPLLDYLLHTGKNETYDPRGLEIPNETGHHASRAVTFQVITTKGLHDSGPLDKIEAMRQATMQANIRKRYSEQRV